MDHILTFLQIVAALGWLPDWSLFALEYMAYALAAIYGLWFFYLAIMNLKRAKDAGTMTPFAKVFAYGIAVPGFLLDIAVNVVIGTVLFLELPHYKRLTLSARMSYHYVPRSTAWRSRLAHWFARNLLDPYDPSGKHID